MADNRTIGIAAALGLAGVGALALFLALPGDEPTAEAEAAFVQAEGPAVELNWEDLVPGDDGFVSASGVVEHDQASTSGPFQTDANVGAIRPELDGKLVRIPGYMTPLDFESAEVSEFLLVPYVGACVHVPPPPANQIVYVDVPGTVPVMELWNAFVAEGTLQAKAQSTELAEVGYTMQLSHLEVYEEDEPEVFDDTNGAVPPPLEGESGTALDAAFDEANRT